jgi:uncharacterized protein
LTHPSNTPGAIETASGRYVDPLNLSCADVCLEDIAHHLAQTNRFNGAACRPMSVAEHTLLVADRLRSQGHSPATILAGQHHDDAEAYLDDVCRPLKVAIRDIYGPAEDHALHVIWEALGLPDDDVDWLAIKTADNWALAAEAYHLLPSRGIGWRDLGGLGTQAYDPCDPLNPPSEAQLRRDDLHWATARRLWLAQHDRLTHALAPSVRCTSCGDKGYISVQAYRESRP